MTVLYVDTLFVLNALIDYLLLLVTARVAGQPLRRLRFFLGGMLGGLYAVAIFLPGFSFLGRTSYQLLFGVLMLLIAYGWGWMLLRQGLIFLAISCALGGGIFAIGLMDGTGLAQGRVVCSVPELKTVLLSAAACYALMGAVLPRVGQHTALSGELRQVTLELLGKKVELTALMDTGNTLTDPVTGRGVPVVEGGAIREILPPGDRDLLNLLRDPIRAAREGDEGILRGRLRLLPYRAVGVDCGLLLGLRLDGVMTGTRRLEGGLVALSPTPVSDGGGYQMLMGGHGG